MHVGTFTPEGTWRRPPANCRELAALGITVIEVMPVADFPGASAGATTASTSSRRRGSTARPTTSAASSIAAHARRARRHPRRGLQPLRAGRQLSRSSSRRDYFTDRYENEWGEAINFDGEHAGPVREFFVANAGYWIDEFHLDGLRLDATQQIFDASHDHILCRDHARACATPRAERRSLSSPRTSRRTRSWCARSEQGGYGLDALWNDDFHHTRARWPLTGTQRGLLHRLLRHAAGVHLGGQVRLSSIRGRLPGRRSGAARRPRTCRPARSSTSSRTTTRWRTPRAASAASADEPGPLPGADGAAAAGPGTPMLFQGQEFARLDAVPLLRRPQAGAGRSRCARDAPSFCAQFPSVATPEMQARLPDPADAATFERCKLDSARARATRRAHTPCTAICCGCAARTRSSAVAPARHRRRGARRPRRSCCATSARTADDRLLLVNLGPRPGSRHRAGAAAGAARRTRVADAWSSEDPRYGGTGTPPVETDDGWHIPGNGSRSPHADVIRKDDGNQSRADES